MNPVLKEKIATYIFVQTCEFSEEGNWTIEFKEIEETFNIELTKEMIVEIGKALYECFPKAMLDVTLTDTEFDIIIGYAFCLNNNEMI